jgi:asparagine synthase (glutamine-hydrolysing)
MCGICGAVGELKQLDHETVHLMTQKLNHRGPDGSGEIAKDVMHFGHTLLSIQDLSLAKQPMISHNKKGCISFNGEIYNQRQLRELLPNFDWVTSGDTEVVLELLSHFGPSILSEFEGMFALAYWNFSDETLTLARDIFGEKPLYYKIQDSCLYFSSEPRNFIQDNIHDLKINIPALAHYVKYMYFPVNSSVIDEVSPVPPGSYLVWQNHRYYLKSFTSNSSKINLNMNPYPVIKKELRTIITEAIESTLLSDVPVGIMLSGGIDSSIITAICSEISPGIPTFCLIMPGYSHDGNFARDVAKKYHTDHFEYQIPEEGFAELVYKILSESPQPIADTSIIPTYFLASEAKKQVKVLISGDGADEIFGGYKYYEKYENLNFGSTSKIYAHLLGIRAEILKHLPSKNIHTSRELYMKAALNSGVKSPYEVWNQDISILEDSALRKLFPRLNTINKAVYLEDENFINLKSVLKWDQHSYLPGNILFKSDSGGMGASLEIRAPFLNKKIDEYVRSLPVSVLGKRKKVLLDTFPEIFTATSANRKKQGFGLQLEKWLSLESMKELSDQYLNHKDLQIFRLLDFKSTQSIVKKSHIVKWSLMSLSIWLETNKL